jgi:RNA polymerase sigma factor (sigma-70 family)
MQRKTVTNKPEEVHTGKAEHHDVEPIVKGILNNDNDIISKIYKEQFEKIKSMVSNFKKLSLDPSDVFQEGLTRAIMNVRDGKFKGDSSFATYLYGICRNICLKEYQQNRELRLHSDGHLAEEMVQDDYELLQLILKEKDRLDEKCRKIIDLRFGITGSESGTRFESIADELGIKADNARQRYGRCFAKLLEMLRQNREFRLLTA